MEHTLHPKEDNIKTITWIKGESSPQKHSDGEETSGVQTFWHIRKPRTSKTTMCGVKLHKGISKLPAKQVDKTKRKEFCFQCRVEAGLEPMFGSSLGGTSRTDKGTQGRAAAHTGSRQNTGKSVQVG